MGGSLENHSGILVPSEECFLEFYPLHRLFDVEHYNETFLENIDEFLYISSYYCLGYKIELHESPISCPLIPKSPGQRGPVRGRS